MSGKRQAISLLLAGALLFLLVGPSHIHFHHDSGLNHDGDSSTRHSIEIGPDMAGTGDLAHHDDDHVLDVSKDALSRKSADSSPQVLVILLALTFIVVTLRKSGLKPSAVPSHIHRVHFRLNPPLRAPPCC
jgi:hypothetical protein